jgi:dTDP-4-dehydrorhamnose reductase
MRVFVTGAGGFVDRTDRPLVHRCIAATRPDAIVHAAIWNDPTPAWSPV